MGVNPSFINMLVTGVVALALLVAGILTVAVVGSSIIHFLAMTI